MPDRIVIRAGILEQYPAVLAPDGGIIEVPESPRRMAARQEYAAALHEDIAMMFSVTET